MILQFTVKIDESKEVSNIYNFEQIDAYYIKKLRKSNNDSVQRISDALDINRTYFYYVENGEKRLSEDMFNKITAYYNVTYHKDVSVYNEAYDLTIKLYESLIFKNDELLSKYEKIFNEKEEIFNNSRGFIFNDLMIAIIYLYKDATVANIKLDEAIKYLPLYDSNIACIYGVIYGFAKSIIYNLEDTKKVLFDIYNNYPIHNVYPVIKGMFYYQLGRIKREKKLYFEAFEYYQKAIGVLQSIYCIERIIQVNIEIANALLSLELYDQAETKYLALLAEAQKNGLRIRACVCLNNLSYLYLINKEYDKCQEFAYKAKKAGSIHHDLNYYLAYCAYKTRPYKEARKIVSKLLKDEDNRHTARMMKMIQGFINDNNDKIDKYFCLIKDEIDKLNNTLEMKLLYEMNIAYYLEKNDIKCLKMINDYFKLTKF